MVCSMRNCEFSLDTTDGLTAWPPSLRCSAGLLQMYFLKVLGLTWFVLANSAFGGAPGISLIRNHSLTGFTMLDSSAAWLVLFSGGGAKTTVVGELNKSIVDGFALLVGHPGLQYAFRVILILLGCYQVGFPHLQLTCAS
jgi:hypothetical protein